MSGVFNVTTIPRAIFVGFTVTLFILGLSSLYSLIAGDGERATLNTLVYSAFGGLVAGTAGYLFRDQRIMSLKAQGRLHPDSDGSELPIGGSPSTIPKLLGYIVMMTFFIQGLLGVLSLLGMSWARYADWGEWFLILAVTTISGVITYFKTRKDRTEKPLESHAPAGGSSVNPPNR